MLNFMAFQSLLRQAREGLGFHVDPLRLPLSKVNVEAFIAVKHLSSRQFVHQKHLLRLVFDDDHVLIE